MSKTEDKTTEKTQSKQQRENIKKKKERKMKTVWGTYGTVREALLLVLLKFQ